MLLCEKDENSGSVLPDPQRDFVFGFKLEIKRDWFEYEIPNQHQHINKASDDSYLTWWKMN
jgi:hypothetical protein